MTQPNPPISAPAVIAAGLKLIDGQVLLVELHARQGKFWLRLPNGQERPLSRDAARVVLGLIGDPDTQRGEYP